MADIAGIAERLSALSVMEAAELSRMLEEKWGVSASAPVSEMPTIVPEAAPVEEQSEFSLTLASIDAAKKINIIKEVRTLTGLGLKEAKQFVEDAPKVLKTELSRDEATRMKKQLEDAGAVITLH